jgi:surfeit locus 1 family protein
MTIVVVIGVIILCRLGLWQLERHNERAALNARIDAGLSRAPIALDPARTDLESLDFQPVEVRGVYDFTQEIVLRGRSYNGASGVHVVTPLKINGSGQAVLVDRGWIPLADADPEQRSAYVEPGEITVRGIVQRTQEAGNGPQDPPLSAERPRLDRWFRVEIPRLQEQINYRLLPIYIIQQPGPNDPELPARAVVSNLGPGSHLGYALQWFSFAIILLVGYIVVIRQQTRRTSGKPADTTHTTPSRRPAP